MLHMVALLAELERGLIVERTKAGQQTARRGGVKLGAKPKLSASQIEYARHLSTRQSVLGLVTMINPMGIR